MKKFILILFSLILFSFSKAQKLKKMGIEFECIHHNFGDIQMWENQAAIFKLTNKNNHAISILPLFSENDLEVIYPEQAIEAGESAIIKAIYYTSGTGPFTRKFPIYFNTSPEAYDLKISGNIKSLSPTAYIQCPQARPDHSKTKMDLFGNVSDIETDIPLSASVIKIVSLNNKSNLTFEADKNGNFGSSLPSGNYEIFVEHPNYEAHQSIFYLGPTTGVLKIKLKPIINKILVADNDSFINDLNIEESNLSINNVQTPLNVSGLEQDTISKKATIEEELVLAKNDSLIAQLNNTKPEKTNTFNFDEDIPYPEGTTTDSVLTTPNLSDNSYTDYVKPEPVIAEKEEAIAFETIKEELDTVIKSPTVITPSPGLSFNSKKYTLRVIDEKTLEPISDASIFAHQIINKTKTIKLKSNNFGLAEISLEKEDYKVIVNADNYISGEIRIKADQDDEIVRVYLSPVSNLFEEIYAAKRKENSEEDLLNQLSFGKTEFSFEEEEKEVALKIETHEPEVVSTKVDEIESQSIDTVVFEAVNTTIPEEEVIEAPISTTVNELQEETANTTPATSTINIDSIQRVMAEIEAEKLKMQLALAEKALELAKKETLLAQQENELAKKEQELGAKTNELEIIKTNFNATQEELDKQKLAINELTVKEIEQENEAPIDLNLSNEYAANNVLFLIDVSSSMRSGNQMELLKESIKNLVLTLRDIDRVAIVTYNQKATVILEGISGSEKKTIIEAVDSLQPYGLTYGVAGLETAYDLLEYNYIENGNNQIILATDGLFSNVNNIMTEKELNRKVRNQVLNNNIILSVIGFGDDENGDRLMTKLATSGSGHFIKIKNPWQTKTILIDEIKINSKL